MQLSPDVFATLRGGIREIPRSAFHQSFPAETPSGRGIPGVPTPGWFRGSSRRFTSLVNLTWFGDHDHIGPGQCALLSYLLLVQARRIPHCLVETMRPQSSDTGPRRPPARAGHAETPALRKARTTIDSVKPMPPVAGYGRHAKRLPQVVRGPLDSWWNA